MRSLRYFFAPVLGLCLAGPAFCQTTQGTSTVSPSTGTQSGEGYSPTRPVSPAPEFPSRNLSLTPSQIDRLKAAMTQLEASYADQIDRLSRESGAERVRLWRELYRNMGSDWMRVASQILTPTQFEQYARHARKARGLESLSDAELQQRLTLTSQQLQEIQSLRDQAERELGVIPVLARENLRAAARRHAAYRQRWYEETNSILDGDQRRMWRDMAGGNFNYRPSMTSPERLGR